MIVCVPRFNLRPPDFTTGLANGSSLVLSEVGRAIGNEEFRKFVVSSADASDGFYRIWSRKT